jgi:hypothetical protein
LIVDAAASAPFTLSTKLAAGVERIPLTITLTGVPAAALSLVLLSHPAAVTSAREAAAAARNA